MKRRVLLAIAFSAANLSLVARAQQLHKLPTVGVLGASTPSTGGEWIAAFVKRLHELGWTEGRNVAIEVRWAEGRNDRFAEIAAEFIRLKVDVIVTYSTPAALAAKRATSVIAIVFALAGHPVGNGLVESLPRPGGNVTGLSLQQTDTAGKRVELLRDLMPDFHRLAVLASVPNPAIAVEINEVRSAASTLGIDVNTFAISRAEDIPAAFDALKATAEAIYVPADALTNSNRVLINTLALAARLPTMHLYREVLEGGGLMSYGPNFSDLFRRAADYVDKILRGEKPADIPVEQPTKI